MVLEWSNESLGLFDLKRNITIRPMASGSMRQMVHPIRSKSAIRNEMPLCVACPYQKVVCFKIILLGILK